MVIPPPSKKAGPLGGRFFCARAARAALRVQASCMGTGQAAGLAAAQACGAPAAIQAGTESGGSALPDDAFGRALPDVRTLPAAPLIARLKALGAAL